MQIPEPNWSDYFLPERKSQQIVTLLVQKKKKKASDSL